MAYLKTLFLLSFILILNLTSGNDEILFIEEPIRNIGILKGNRGIREDFILENKTSETLKIRLLPPDCSCNMAFSFREEKLKPHANCKLTLWFTPPNFDGDFSAKIPIEVESELKKYVYELMLEAYIISQVEYRPYRLDLGDISIGDNIKSYIHLIFPDTLLDINEIKISTAENIFHKLELSKDKKIARVTILVNIKKKENLNEIIYLEIPWRGQGERFYIPVYGVYKEK